MCAQRKFCNQPMQLTFKRSRGVLLGNLVETPRGRFANALEQDLTVNADAGKREVFAALTLTVHVPQLQTVQA